MLESLKQGATKNENKLSSFLKEQIELSTAVMAHGDRCTKWYNYRMDMRRKELEKGVVMRKLPNNQLLFLGLQGT